MIVTLPFTSNQQIHIGDTWSLKNGFEGRNIFNIEKLKPVEFEQAQSSHYYTGEYVFEHLDFVENELIHQSDYSSYVTTQNYAITGGIDFLIADLSVTGKYLRKRDTKETNALVHHRFVKHRYGVGVRNPVIGVNTVLLEKEKPAYYVDSIVYGHHLHGKYGIKYSKYTTDDKFEATATGEIKLVCASITVKLAELDMTTEEIFVSVDKSIQKKGVSMPVNTKRSPLSELENLRDFFDILNSEEGNNYLGTPQAILAIVKPIPYDEIAFIYPTLSTSWTQLELYRETAIKSVIDFHVMKKNIRLKRKNILISISSLPEKEEIHTRLTNLTSDIPITPFERTIYDISLAKEPCFITDHHISFIGKANYDVILYDIETIESETRKLLEEINNTIL